MNTTPRRPEIPRKLQKRLLRVYFDGPAGKELPVVRFVLLLRLAYFSNSALQALFGETTLNRDSCRTNLRKRATAGPHVMMPARCRASSTLLSCLAQSSAGVSVAARSSVLDGRKLQFLFSGASNPSRGSTIQLSSSCAMFHIIVLFHEMFHDMS